MGLGEAGRSVDECSNRCVAILLDVIEDCPHLQTLRSIQGGGDAESEDCARIFL
jgi:hypothetical protein